MKDKQVIQESLLTGQETGMNNVKHAGCRQSHSSDSLQYCQCVMSEQPSHVKCDIEPVRRALNEETPQIVHLCAYEVPGSSAFVEDSQSVIWLRHKTV